MIKLIMIAGRWMALLLQGVPAITCVLRWTTAGRGGGMQASEARPGVRQLRRWGHTQRSD